MLLNCGVGEDSWESLGSNQSILKEISSGWPMEGIMLKLKCQYLATWCEHLTHWKRPWCWGRLRAGGEVDNRGWNGWMASWTRWTWVWVDSGSWWWTGRPGVPRFMGSQRVRHNWVTKLIYIKYIIFSHSQNYKYHHDGFCFVPRYSSSTQKSILCVAKQVSWLRVRMDGWTLVWVYPVWPYSPLCCFGSEQARWAFRRFPLLSFSSYQILIGVILRVGLPD